MWTLSSPNGALVIQVRLTESGSLLWQVQKNGREALLPSPLGLATDLADFTGGLAFAGQDDATEINETYSLPVGKKAVYTNHAMECRLRFAKDGLPFVLALRAYDNGAAFRYEIPASGGGLQVRREITAYDFPAAFDTLWLQNLVPSYENPYDRSGWGATLADRHFGMPALLRAADAGLWVMVNEAAVLNANGSYCVSHLLGTQARRLSMAFALEENGAPLACPLPFASPWRYLLVEDSLAGLVEATLNYNLNPPAAFADTDWIRPGRALWAWWSSDMGAQRYTEACRYVDVAAALGFEGVLIDAWWEESWIADFCAYAHSQNISAWVWTDMQSIDTREKAERLLPLWKRYGADAVKIDFFENDSALTASQYQMMAEIMQREKLMINFHGCTKPMGEGRTWPHFMTAEGILGMEYYKWSDGPDAAHNCTVPFIRNAVGPMDYTPVAFSHANRNTTMAHQMALSVVFESGVTHIASSIYHLLPWFGVDFLRRTKPKYDGLRLLSGDPGDHVCMLRWVAQSEEYLVGCICNGARYQRLPLDFLPDGPFEAEVYRDKLFGNHIECERIAVTKDSVLHLEMPAHGGAGVYIARKAAPLPPLASQGYMSPRCTPYLMSAAQPFLGSMKQPLSEALTALVLHGGLAMPVQAQAAGPHTLRLYYSAEQPCTLRASNGRDTQLHALPASGAGTVFSVSDLILPLQAGTNRLTIARTDGAAPVLVMLHVLDNQPDAGLVLPAETGVLSGSGSLVSDGRGAWQATSMAADSTLTFADVPIAETGDYLVRIEYTAGPTGHARILCGDADVPAVLGGVGIFGSTKAGDAISREVKVRLPEGLHALRLVAESALPPIARIVLLRL